MTVTDLAVELWSARAVIREGAVEDVPVFTLRAAHPPVRRCTARADGDVLVVGRRGHDDEHHLAWTGGTSEDDLQLSRSQLRFTRHDHGWRVAVPGPPGSKRHATVRYWASGRSQDLLAGGCAVTLDPASHVCLSVVTPRTCYWALVTTPAEAAVDDTGPARRSGPAGTLAYDGPVGDDRLPSLPGSWRRAVEVKFRPYLTWPMALAPSPVEPRHYVDPATGQDGTSEKFRRWVKRTVLETQAAAATRGFEPREPSAIDVRLVEWLVARGELTHEDDRAPWPEPAESRPEEEEERRAG